MTVLLFCQVLGTITFLHSGGFEAGDATQRPASSTRMYMRRLTPVIECGVEGNELPFTFDTGASKTDLSVRYYEQFRAKARSWKQRQSESSGAGGTVKRTVSTLIFYTDNWSALVLTTSKNSVWGATVTKTGPCDVEVVPAGKLARIPVLVFTSNTEILFDA